jgi:hypothetical protein
VLFTTLLPVAFKDMTALLLGVACGTGSGMVLSMLAHERLSDVTVTVSNVTADDNSGNGQVNCLSTCQCVIRYVEEFPMMRVCMAIAMPVKQEHLSVATGSKWERPALMMYSSYHWHVRTPGKIPE